MKTIKDTFKKLFDPIRIFGTNVGSIQLGFSDDTQSPSATLSDSLYVNRALDLLKMAVSDVSFSMHQITTVKGEYETIDTHPVLDLLYRPNPLQTKTEFLRVMVANFAIFKEAFIRIVLDASGNPIALVNMHPVDITIKLGADGLPIYYYASIAGEVTLTSLEVIHIKDPDTRDQLRAVPRLSALLLRVSAEVYAMQYQNNMFSRNGNPDGIINFKSNAPTQEEAKLLKTSFLNSFRGSNDSNRYAFVNGDIAVTPLSNNVLDVAGAKTSIRDDIFLAFGIPKSLATSDDVNRANAQAGLQQFREFTVQPMFNLFAEVFTERFINPYFGMEFVLVPDKMVTQAPEDTLKELDTATGRWITINEARTRSGYEPVDGGDVLGAGGKSSNSPLAPVMLSIKRIEKTYKARVQGNSKLYEYLKSKSEAVSAIKRAHAQRTLTSPSFKLAFTKAMEDVRQRGARQLEVASKRYLKEQYARVKERLVTMGGTVDHVDDILKLFEEREEIAKWYEPIQTAIALKVGTTALSPLQLIGKAVGDYSLSPVAQRKLKLRAEMFEDSVAGTSYKRVQEVISANMRDGVGAIATALEALYEDMAGARSATIAQTESCYLVGLGTEEAYRSSNVVTGKEWLTTGDSVVREEHLLNEGEGVISKDGAFSNGEHFPGEASINCRCTLAPVIDFTDV